MVWNKKNQTKPSILEETFRPSHSILLCAQPVCFCGAKSQFSPRCTRKNVLRPRVKTKMIPYRQPRIFTPLRAKRASCASSSETNNDFQDSRAGAKSSVTLCILDDSSTERFWSISCHVHRIKSGASIDFSPLCAARFNCGEFFFFCEVELIRQCKSDCPTVCNDTTPP